MRNAGSHKLVNQIIRKRMLGQPAIKDYIKIQHLAGQEGKSSKKNDVKIMWPVRQQFEHSWDVVAHRLSR